MWGYPLLYFLCYIQVSSLSVLYLNLKMKTLQLLTKDFCMKIISGEKKWMPHFPSQLDPCLTLINLEQQQVDRLSVKSEWWMSSTNYKSKSVTNTAGVHSMFAFATLSVLQA